jgi:mannobiose 2-epimerase
MRQLEQYRDEVLHELTDNILPFSLCFVVDREHGGFHTLPGNDTTAQQGAPKGLVQHSRMLWIFARATRILGDPEYARTAAKAHQELLDWFRDDAHGGYYWIVDYQGQSLYSDKFTYGQAFALYGLVESYLTSRDPATLDEAKRLFHLIEERCSDPDNGGYWEARRRDWSPAPDLWVDDTTLPVAKSMNTHLHLLEAYGHLLRAWDDARLRESLRVLVQIMLQRIVQPVGHQMALHFDRRWHPLSDRVSYGHDIEASWLLMEAATALGDQDLLTAAREAALLMADAVLARGVDSDGGLWDEGDPSGVARRHKTWWPQAEAMVGFLNCYQMSSESRFLQASLATWRFVQAHMVDREHGEWYWSVDQMGRPGDQGKAGPWKAAYHNGRACLEVWQRAEQLLEMTGPS